MLTRPRRLRASKATRDLVASVHVPARSLVAPYFVIPGENRREPVPSMPGVHRLTADLLADEIRQDQGAGIRACLLFGIPAAKDARGEAAADPTGPVPEAIRRLRKEFSADDLAILADVCLCEYASHGHCGLPDAHGHVIGAKGAGESATPPGVVRIQNDASLPLLANAAKAYADAGADWIAPSDMMDGRIGFLRNALDDAGHENVAILSYAVKYASAYYGPFRDAAGSAPRFGDRRAYQMDARRDARDALREVALDASEGADAVMVKPALAYLDVIQAVRAQTALPVACYNVSGEYSMVKAAAERGWLDEGAIVRENLAAMKRAGADIIITYHAREAATKGWLP